MLGLGLDTLAQTLSRFLQAQFLLPVLKAQNSLQNHIFKNHLDFAARFLASNPPESTCKCKQNVTTQDSWPVHMSRFFYYT